MTKHTEIKSLTQIINETGTTGYELREMMWLDVDHLDRLHARYVAADQSVYGEDTEIAERLLDESLKAEQDWVNENAHLAFAITWQQHQISRQINSDCHFSPMTLCNYATGEHIRQATILEAEESIEAEQHDSGSGVILVEIDGKPSACYVS
jgi:hypothetical protein